MSFSHSEKSEGGEKGEEPLYYGFVRVRAFVYKVGALRLKD